MKNLKVMMMTLMMCLITMVSFGQERYTTYDNLYNEKAYEISISHKDNGKYTLYVDMMSMDKLSRSGGIIITEKEHDLFLTTLNEAKVKYTEWVTTAKENNVTDLSKSMTYKAKVGGFFQYGSKWNFQHVVNLTFDFRIVAGENLLIVIPFGLGVLIGIVLIAKLIEYLFNRYPVKTYYGVLGFVIASLVAIIKPVLSVGPGLVEVIVSILLVIIGSLIAYKLGDQ